MSPLLHARAALLLVLFFAPIWAQGNGAPASPELDAKFRIFDPVSETFLDGEPTVTQSFYAELLVLGQVGTFVYPMAWLSLHPDPEIPEEVANSATLKLTFPWLDRPATTYGALVQAQIEIPNVAVDAAIAAVGTTESSCLGSYQPILGGDIQGMNTRTWDPRSLLMMDPIITAAAHRIFWCDVMYKPNPGFSCDPTPGSPPQTEPTHRTVLNFDRMMEKMAIHEATAYYNDLANEGPLPNGYATVADAVIGDMQALKAPPYDKMSRQAGLKLHVQFIGVRSVLPMATSAFAIESTSLALNGNASTVPTERPRFVWSNPLAIAFTDFRDPETKNFMMAPPAMILGPVASGGTLYITLYGAVAPTTIRIRDAANTLFVGTLLWHAPSLYRVQLPPTLVPGTAQITRIQSPFDIINGNGAPWAFFTITP